MGLGAINVVFSVASGKGLDPSYVGFSRYRFQRKAHEMAAKTATRNAAQPAKDESFEPYVVVDAVDGSRLYFGEGVRQVDAERMASQMLRPAVAVKLADVGNDAAADEEVGDRVLSADEVAAPA